MKLFHILIIALFLATGCFNILGTPGNAMAQSVVVQPQTRDVHTGMPFQLTVVVSDFEEAPQPEIDPFEIPGADIQLLGVSPRISQMTSIINGKRSFKKDVSFIFAFQVTTHDDGLYNVPVITARQGNKEASSAQKFSFMSTALPETQDMRIELNIPSQKIWVGQTFEITLDWYLRRSAASQDFTLPVLNEMSDSFELEEPADSKRWDSIILRVGTRQIEFPYTRDSVMVKGLEYTRLRMPIRLTALKSGLITIPPSQVTAELETGRTRDFFGLQPETELFRAKDIQRSVIVLDLPQDNRPDTFSNAMGEEYSISVSADRTILNAGDPIILTIEISSVDSLDGLILPPLNLAGLDEQFFGLSNEQPIGETIEGRKDERSAKNLKIRRFTVPVRVKSDRVKEIPPIAFSFFNPKTEQYSTVRSKPIALIVSAVDKVGISEVVSGQKTPKESQPQTADGQPSKPDKAQPVSITDSLDLGLMSTESDLSALSVQKYSRGLRVAIYVFPFAVWALLILVRKTRKKRASSAVQRDALQILGDALDSAVKQPRREAASALTNALNGWIQATQSDKKPFQPLLERIDEEAYRPESGDKPLPKSLLDEIREALPKHTHENYVKMVSSLSAICFAILMLVLPVCALAQSADSQSESARLSEAVETYHKAMETTDRADRISLFRRSAAIFESLAATHPHSAALRVDTANAALGAADFGRASLYYHRALAIDPDIDQAKANLAAIQSNNHRENPSSQAALATTFFLNGKLSGEKRLLLAAVFFAIGVLLIIPWRKNSRKVLSFLAVIPFVVWIWLMAGVYAQQKSADVVVMTEAFLKSADNPGASNLTGSPVEPGSAFSVIQQRGSWIQVENTSGQKGWISDSAIAWIKE